MATVTKAIGPLHLEDLEPHRFEDLVRQLLYDFRPWRDLEATGRSGGDEGFDVRAWEMTITPEHTAEEGEAGEDDEENENAPQEKQWLIQCKREKAISPSKLKTYLDDLPDVNSEGLYGIIFVAACDFSKKARDLFYKETRKRGFMEVKIWGKAELEDQLFQPKNDHLLFAYFGVSLQVRRRTLKTTIRARLSTKRKAQKSLLPLRYALVRDVTDDRYPYPDDNNKLPLIERRRWKVFQIEGCHHNGIWFSIFRAPAYIADDGIHWDYAENAGRVFIHRMQDPWRTAESEQDEEAERPHYNAVREKWDSLGMNRAWLKKFIILPYDSILAIDEDGDDIFKDPHIFVANFDGKSAPFLPTYQCILENIDRFARRYCEPNPDKRVKIFDRG